MACLNYICTLCCIWLSFFEAFSESSKALVSTLADRLPAWHISGLVVLRKDLNFIGKVVIVRQELQAVITLVAYKLS